MAVIQGVKTCFIAPWLIVLAEDVKPLDFAHEIAHAMLFLKGFSRSWAQAAGMTQKQYEALVWSVCAKFVKEEAWDLEYIQNILEGQ
jgi:hypothetical protein